MGLAEKRIIKDLSETKLPDAQSAIDSATGGGVALAVDWDSFSSCSADDLGNIVNWGFRTIDEALQRLCQDSVGKEALQESPIDQIVIQNVESADDKGAEVDGGTVRVKLSLHNGHSGSLSDDDVRQPIENAL